jgi:hypothetical protein
LPRANPLSDQQEDGIRPGQLVGQAGDPIGPRREDASVQEDIKIRPLPAEAFGHAFGAIDIAGW